VQAGVVGERAALRSASARLQAAARRALVHRALPGWLQAVVSSFVSLLLRSLDEMWTKIAKMEREWETVGKVVGKKPGEARAGPGAA